MISDACNGVCKDADRDVGCAKGCAKDCGTGWDKECWTGWWDKDCWTCWEGCADDADGDVANHAGKGGSSGAAWDIGIGMAIDEEELGGMLPFACIRPPSIPPISPPV